jgi:polysaccharide export outer membrane protein
MRAIPGLRTPELALATPAPLPAPPLPTVPVRAGIPGAPVVPFERYMLDSGDRVRIVVFGQDNLSRVYGVDNSGYVALPLVGAERARGLTTGELAAAIARGLSAKYVKDPKVTAEVETYRPVFVLGEVKKAGQFPYVNAMTVEMAVAIAQRLYGAGQ